MQNPLLQLMSFSSDLRGEITRALRNALVKSIAGEKNEKH